MHRFSLVLLLLSLCYCAKTQDTLTVLYAKDSSSIIKLHNDLKIVYVFSDSEPYSIPDQLSVKLSIDNASIMVLTNTETTTNKRTVTLGEFPSILLDNKKEGHITFGKALLAKLDSVGSDSTITLDTEIILKNKLVKGPLYLDFKGGPGVYETYWNEIEYYSLLEKQAIVQDSITKITADKQRAKALLDASNKYVEATITQMELNQKDLDKKYSQFNTTMESLKKINARIDESFEKSKLGQQLTDGEKKQIAFLTTDGNNLKKQLKQRPDGPEALKVFDKLSKAITQNRAAKKQFDSANTIYQDRTKQLNIFTDQGKKIQARLNVLKSLLKL